MNKIIALLLSFVLFSSFTKPIIAIDSKSKAIIVWQPSHQTDTGKDFSEAATCNAIVEAAMAFKPKFKEFKVWSLNKPDLHHANVGSNTIIAHTTAVENGKISGYAYEIQESNKRKPDVFIAVHNNGGSKSNAVWGFIHDGDQYEAENRDLAAKLIAAISGVTDLQNRGVFLDSSTGRNDYKCQKTEKRAFYSIDENVNTAKYRVLLEVGDNAESRALLTDPAGQKRIGQAIKIALAKWLEEKGL
ncbi:N-acetylmuramoyl-L-alanine amidase family protein [Pedobacter insulae]|uniref:N-acetylmuramoyl-L-alanine amidase n=1 Tax=Pedobacter insulae TaxID=414048 RepID=A0A1I2UD40_9SPHI|nr:N-acetylmuramoyl-L-alanine amidase [Pedobacter insulae]SFG74968.1 N-acetylmuramoyl-L-alanine amidase [Pedobacter insulae]